jgi:hypothetical protein
MLDKAKVREIRRNLKDVEWAENISYHVKNLGEAVEYLIQAVEIQQVEIKNLEDLVHQLKNPYVEP